VATLLRENGFGRDVAELLLAHSEKNSTVSAYSHIELAADRKRALLAHGREFRADYAPEVSAA
jgi:integrase